MILNQHAVALVFTILLWVTNAKASEPYRKFLGCPVPDFIGKWCCDDYQAKCQPCVKVPLCFGCDDYCRKSMPEVCTPLCFTCDDYCQKCEPEVCRPPLSSFLQCPSERRTRGRAARARDECDRGIATETRVLPPQTAGSRFSSRPIVVAPLPSGSRADELVKQSRRRPVNIKTFER